jgi:hypothetical protein
MFLSAPAANKAAKSLVYYDFSALFTAKCSGVIPS